MPRARETALPFVAGIAAGAAAAVTFLGRRRTRALHPRIIRALPRAGSPPMAVFAPGICGSQLLRRDGSEAWLNLGNTIGHHDLRLPGTLPFQRSRDELHPGLMIGTDTLLPRAFGFTEYADVLELLDSAGYEPGVGPGARYAVFSYDWRRDLVESAQHLALRLEGLAKAMDDPDARFHLIGYSMGGLVLRYYLRFGGGEPRPDAPVTWAGARRIASLIQVATPNAGSLPSLAAVLGGERVGFSHTTLAASVVQRMPSIYQLLPPLGTGALVDTKGRVLADDLQEPATWQKFGWGPFATTKGPGAAERAFVCAALERARALHAALARPAPTPCPVPVYVIGGDCLLTPVRAVVGDTPRGSSPRFEAKTRKEQDLLFEPGDGRVARSSLLGAHLPGAVASAEVGSGYSETTRAFFCSADHHGLFGDPAMQSLLLRLLLRPAPERVVAQPRAAGI